ncbi:hypothetical protein AALO_G00205790 [Alosa alosa]|uniref:Beta-defensin n=1 Tax=Alosa alosa TaxID=278164 RepID=A0AAV6G7B1_9TELE|nr:hypothetical protein AALO_G00205790 [Alosa alosa]
MIYQRFMLLALVVLLSITYDANAAVAFPWGCTDYKGVCRRFCLPAEFPFAIFKCGGAGFICCLSHI